MINVLQIFKTRVAAVLMIFLSVLSFASPALAGVYSIGDASKFAGSAAGRSGVSDSSVESIVGRGLRGAIGLAGIFFFILMVYGGFTWMLARGNEEKVTKARNTIIAAMIGLGIVAMAYAITVFMANFIN